MGFGFKSLDIVSSGFTASIVQIWKNSDAKIGPCKHYHLEKLDLLVEYVNELRDNIALILELSEQPW